jgi:glycine/sarcosine/betaine reductase complex component A
MDLEIQQRVKDTVDKLGAENVVIILGGAEAESAGLSAETVTAGDPTYAGPLAGVELGLRVYHVVEDEIKAEFDEAVYEEQCGMMEMVLELDAIKEEVGNVRKQYTKFND